jgi:hypothetical protein
MTEVFDPVMAAIPPEFAAKLERPQLFLEVLDHYDARSWGSTSSGTLVDTARSYASQLANRPHERNLAAGP